jgi:hypothetical protein
MTDTLLSFSTSNGTTAQTVTSAQRCSTVVVTNDTGQIAFVTTDGTTASPVV